MKISPFHFATVTPCAGEEAEPPQLRLRGLALSSLPAGVDYLNNDSKHIYHLDNCMKISKTKS